MNARDASSPCVGVCALDRSGYCRGCWRTIAEISAWPRLSPEDRARILVEVATRQALVK